MKWIINFVKINNAACVFEWIYFFQFAGGVFITHSIMTTSRVAMVNFCMELEAILQEYINRIVLVFRWENCNAAGAGLVNCKLRIVPVVDKLVKICVRSSLKRLSFKHNCCQHIPSELAQIQCLLMQFLHNFEEKKMPKLFWQLLLELSNFNSDAVQEYKEWETFV